MVSGNILASAHGGVGYLQPLSRVSSSSRSILRSAFCTSVISLNSKAFTIVMNKFGLSDTNQYRSRQTRSNRSQVSQNRMMNLKSNENLGVSRKLRPPKVRPRSKLKNTTCLLTYDIKFTIRSHLGFFALF